MEWKRRIGSRELGRLCSGLRWSRLSHGGRGQGARPAVVGLVVEAAQIRWKRRTGGVADGRELGQYYKYPYNSIGEKNSNGNANESCVQFVVIDTSMGLLKMHSAFYSTLDIC